MVKRIVASGNIEGVDYDYLYNTNNFNDYFNYLDIYRPYELSFAGLSEFQDTGLETQVVFDVTFVGLDNITKSCVVLGVDYKDVYNYMSQNFGKVIKISKSSLQITNI